MRKKSIVLIENMLLRVFSDECNFQSAWYPAYEIIATAMCTDESKKKIDEARRNLGIESAEICGIMYWKWASYEKAEDVWKRVSAEVERLI